MNVPLPFAVAFQFAGIYTIVNSAIVNMKERG
jgi:hypothetical protein